MQKKKIIKLAVLNVIIILINIILFSNAFVGIDFSGGSILSRSIGYVVIIMSIVVFIVGNYNILRIEQKEVEPQYEIKSLEDCKPAINFHIRDKDVFDNQLDFILNQIDGFTNKKSTIDKILLQKFTPEEMSYRNFQNVLFQVEDMMFNNIKSIVNRISAFDEQEYLKLQKHATMSETSRSRLNIYQEYIDYVNQALESNEQILLRLEHLLSELSKLNSFESGEIEQLPAMREIDDLINKAKWYK